MRRTFLPVDAAMCIDSLITSVVFRCVQNYTLCTSKCNVFFCLCEWVLKMNSWNLKILPCTGSQAGYLLQRQTYTRQASALGLLYLIEAFLDVPGAGLFLSSLSDTWDPFCIWMCPKLTTYCSEVFELINLHLQLSLPVLPDLALLGLHDDAQRSYNLKLLIS